MFIETYVAEKKFINKQKRRLNVSGVLRILGVSSSGYRDFKNRKPSKQEVRKKKMMKKIQSLYDDSYQNYGAPKITRQLRKIGEKISEKTVGNYMNQMGIKAQYIKPYIVTTRDSDFSATFKNILRQRFHQESPNTVWCSDITYIWTETGFVYLTTIMDLFSRKIIAWTLSTTMEAAWVVDAINKAKKRRPNSKAVIIHSDRGSQYTCKEYKQATKNMTCSYSKKAYPWDNACMESFYSLIKREWLNRYRISDYNHAYRLVFEYIETFYNTVRIHGSIGYKSPNGFEKEYEEELKKIHRKVG